MIFNSISDVQSVFTVANSSDFNRIAPHLANAERDYLLPILGENMYHELVEFSELGTLDNPTDVQADMLQLLSTARTAVAHLAYFAGYEVLNAYIGDGGFKRSESNSVKSLFKYQEDNLKAYLRNTGFNALDACLQYMELHASSFAEWIQSPTYTIYRSAIFPNTKTFDQNGIIGNSRLVFLRLQAPLALVEDLHIAPILGASVYAEFKAGLSAESVPAKVTVLLPLVRNAMRYLALAMLMQDTGADITDRGLYFESTQSTTLDNIQRQPADMERVASVSARYHAIGQSYLLMITTHLGKNASDWPNYSGAGALTYYRDNTNKKTFVA